MNIPCLSLANHSFIVLDECSATLPSHDIPPHDPWREDTFSCAISGPYPLQARPLRFRKDAIEEILIDFIRANTVFRCKGLLICEDVRLIFQGVEKTVEFRKIVDDCSSEMSSKCSKLIFIGRNLPLSRLDKTFDHRLSEALIDRQEGLLWVKAFVGRS